MLTVAVETKGTPVLGVDPESYASAVDAIYAAADDPMRWTEALSAVAACFGDIGAIFVFPRGDGAFGSIVSPGLEALKRGFESSGWRDSDPRFVRAAERGFFASGEVVTDRDVASPEEIESHPFYGICSALTA